MNKEELEEEKQKLVEKLIALNKEISKLGYEQYAIPVGTCYFNDVQNAVIKVTSQFGDQIVCDIIHINNEFPLTVGAVYHIDSLLNIDKYRKMPKDTWDKVLKLAQELSNFKKDIKKKYYDVINNE